MKKFITRAVLAMTVATIAVHEASAWINSKFGVGLSWCKQSGGNNFLFGLFQNGQPPAPDCGVGCGVPMPAPCPNGGLFQPGAYPGVGAPAPVSSAAGLQGQTQSRSRTVNYQYPFYNGYGR